MTIKRDELGKIVFEDAATGTSSIQAPCSRRSATRFLVLVQNSMLTVGIHRHRASGGIHIQPCGPKAFAHGRETNSNNSF